jgi:membrane protease YdiL (CAAX protease family)
MTTTRQLIAILFFCVSMRTVVTTLLSVSDLPISGYASLTSQIFFFLLLLAICVVVIKRNGEILLTQEEIKSPFFSVWNGFVVALALVGFTLGEHAVEVLIVSNIDIGIAYQLWNFPQVPRSPDFLSPRFGLDLFSAALLAPVTEELFFRKLLLNSLCRAYSAKAAVLISSLVFTAMHFSQVYYVSCFVFAMTLALLYLQSKSILICIAAHGAYNLFERFSSLYYILPSMNGQDITRPNSWLSYLVMYVFSVAALALLAVRFERVYGADRRENAVQRPAACPERVRE